MSANPQTHMALQEKARRVLPGGTFGGSGTSMVTSTSIT